MVQYKNGNGHTMSIDEKIEEVQEAFNELKLNGNCKKLQCDPKTLIDRLKLLKKRKKQLELVETV